MSGEGAPVGAAKGVPAPADQRRERKLRLAGAAGQRLFDALLGSCRSETWGEEHHRQFRDRGQPVIFALWHGRLLPCTWLNRGQDLVTLVSQHKDGEYIARVVQRWGYHTVRGSSSRGGTEALRELMRWVRRGRSLAITPDGPRGPRETMKLGPLYLAQRTGAPIIPALAGASRGWYFGGWDRFLVPKPFARIRMGYDEPVWVPRDADEAELERIAAHVGERLAALKAKVDDFSGRSS